MTDMKSRLGDLPSKRIKIEDLRRLMERILTGFGVKPEAAGTVAEPFFEADLRGLYIQGLHHLMHSMVRNLRHKKLRPGGMPRVVKEGAAFAIVDGDLVPGPLSGRFAADIAIKKAREAGSAAVGVVRSTDMYMIGHYAERMARAGVIGIVFVDAPPMIPPVGGMAEIIGTNPMAIGIPTAGDDPFVLDISSASFSYWRIRDLAHYGKKLPPGIALGPDGRPTVDAAEAVKGFLLPFGGHKGYGIALMGAFLAGNLLGCDVGEAMRSWRYEKPTPTGNQGHLFLAVDPGAFGDPDAFRKAASVYLGEVKGSKRASGSSEVRIPGEGSLKTRAQSLRDGAVSVDAMVWERAAKLADELGFAMPGTVNT